MLIRSHCVTRSDFAILKFGKDHYKSDFTFYVFNLSPFEKFERKSKGTQNVTRLFYAWKMSDIGIKAIKK